MAKYLLYALLLLSSCMADRELIEDETTTMTVIRYSVAYRGARTLVNIHMRSSYRNTEHVLWAREPADTLIFFIGKKWMQTERK